MSHTPLPATVAEMRLLVERLEGDLVRQYAGQRPDLPEDFWRAVDVAKNRLKLMERLEMELPKIIDRCNSNRRYPSPGPLQPANQPSGCVPPARSGQCGGPRVCRLTRLLQGEKPNRFSSLVVGD
jgi:hypothetical protein